MKTNSDIEWTKRNERLYNVQVTMTSVSAVSSKEVIHKL